MLKRTPLKRKTPLRQNAKYRAKKPDNVKGGAIARKATNRRAGPPVDELMFAKHPAIHSEALRKSAEGEDCTLQIPGHCNYDRETTVLCHLQFDGGVMGGKADDTSAAYGCSGCHAAIDQRLISDDERIHYMARGLVRTLKRMYERGLLVIKGAG